MKSIISMTICVVVFNIIFLSTGIYSQFVESQKNKVSNQPNGNGSSKNGNIDELITRARETGMVRIIVGLRLSTTPEGFLTENQKIFQRNSIKSIQDNLISQVSRFGAKLHAQYEYIPFVAMRADENALKFMRESPLVSSIEEDRPLELTLAQSIPIIGADVAWNMGYTGSGKVIAIIDSGVDKFHPFLANKVVSEACYSQPSSDIPEVGGLENLCGGFEERTDPGSGLPCGYGTANGVCAHGTHVAGIAAGNGANSGVAKDAQLIAMMVMTRQYIVLPNGNTSSTVRAFSSDILKGLNRVIFLKNNTTLDITSVNISIGDGAFDAPCGSGGAYEIAITNLKSLSVATVIASGNGNEANKISTPACVEPSVSVGATGDGSPYDLCSLIGCTTYQAPLDQIWSVSSLNLGTNSASFLDLLAPGAGITSSTPGGAFRTYAGTSMAAPHVAGSWAVIRQRFPNATVDQVLDALKQTGMSIVDTRSGAGNRIKPRIKVDDAITYLEESLSAPRFDFNGDGKSDISVFRPGEGNWYLRKPDGTYGAYNWGLGSDELVPADFDGDGQTDIAVWRGSTGEWFIYNIATNSYYGFHFGTSGDIPAPGDFDGDGKDDAAVYRPSTGTWYILRSSDSGISVDYFGVAEDKPVVEDYDGDGKDDIAIFRPSVSQWWIKRSQAGIVGIAFGSPGDKTVQGDYTGDGKADVAVYRPIEGSLQGLWYVLRSEDNSVSVYQFGVGSDTPTPADYDGDGKTDYAVYRAPQGVWYIQGSTAGFSAVPFGISTDIAVPNVYSVP